MPPIPEAEIAQRMLEAGRQPPAESPAPRKPAERELQPKSAEEKELKPVPVPEPTKRAIQLPLEPTPPPAAAKGSEPPPPPPKEGAKRIPTPVSVEARRRKGPRSYNTDMDKKAMEDPLGSLLRR